MIRFGNAKSVVTHASMSEMDSGREQGSGITDSWEA